MTSFAKVCIDLSNNLRNLRFGKSSPQPTLNTNAIGSSASAPNLSHNSHVASVCYTAANAAATGTGITTTTPAPPTLFPLLGEAKSNGTRNGSPTLPPKVRHHHHKKQAPPVPPKTNKCSEPSVRQPTSPTRTPEDVHQQAPLADLVQPYPSPHQSPVPTTRRYHPPKPVTTGVSSDSVRDSFFQSSTIPQSNGAPNGSPARLPVPSSPTAGHRRVTTSNPAPRSDEVMNGGLSPRFSPRLTFSPTMAQRVATLARSCQYNYGGSDASSVKSGTSSSCSSPIMPHRGATVAAIKQRLLSQGLKIDLRMPTRKFASTRYRDYMRRVQRGRPVTIDALWADERVLSQIFQFLSAAQLLTCGAVCRHWFQLIARLGCLDRATVTLNVKRLWTDAMREQVAQAPRSVGCPDSEAFATKENIPLPVSWIDQRLERKLIERLNAAVRRGIRSLCLVQMADRYAQILLNAIMTVLYDCGNPDVTLAKSLSQSAADKAVSDDSLSCSRPRCRLSIDDESRQPLAHVQSFTLSPTTAAISTRQNPSTASSPDFAAPHYFSPLTVGITSTSTTPDNLNRISDSSMLVDACDGLHDGGSANSTSDPDSQSGSQHPALGRSPIHTFHNLAVRCCSVVDSTMEQLIRVLPGLRVLELQCCNELSELAFWTCLVPSLVHLRIYDCINVSDESIGAITQMLPDLKQLTLQAYHVTDAAFSYFSPKQRASLEFVCLTHCMDVTNQGLINLAFALPGLQQLSVSGCTNLTDDGLDVICENLRQLRRLDLSWCAKITDSGIECVAGYLALLQQLTLDRCLSVTDIGIGQLTTLTQLQHLSVRWCVNLSDGMIPHLLGMTRLTYLSVAGCKRVTEEGICQLARHPRLRRLELTHCPGASNRVKAYLNENLADCRLID